MIDDTNPDTIITDDLPRVSKQFSGQIIAILPASDPSLTGPQVRQSPVVFSTSLQIADPKTLRKLMGLAA